MLLPCRFQGDQNTPGTLAEDCQLPLVVGDTYHVVAVGQSNW